MFYFRILPITPHVPGFYLISELIPWYVRYFFFLVFSWFLFSFDQENSGRNSPSCCVPKKQPGLELTLLKIIFCLSGPNEWPYSGLGTESACKKGYLRYCSRCWSVVLCICGLKDDEDQGDAAPGDKAVAEKEKSDDKGKNKKKKVREIFESVSGEFRVFMNSERRYSIDGLRKPASAV